MEIAVEQPRQENGNSNSAESLHQSESPDGGRAHGVGQPSLDKAATSSKRTANPELPRPANRRSESWQRPGLYNPYARGTEGLKKARRRPNSQTVRRPYVPRNPIDSGYKPTSPSRRDNFQVEPHRPDEAILEKSSPVRYPGLILQPESSPIPKDQLAAEVKGIYAGLVMVEAKCINIDTAQANDPNSKLGPEQWQALIALHRTLLYEHHDFLMATQHPSASAALRGLATKYSMPARMWRHGIHAFLEVLRHRRPESEDYMLAFIYLAYQMMALLFETVPHFTDTWIECLGK